MTLVHKLISERPRVFIGSSKGLDIFMARMREFWPFNAEPGECVTLASVFIRISCLHTLVTSNIAPSAFRLITKVDTAEMWTLIGIIIFSAHLMSVYYEKKWPRILMQITSSGFLLMYCLCTLIAVPYSTSGWDTLLFFLTSLVTVEVLLRKHWKD